MSKKLTAKEFRDFENNFFKKHGEYLEEIKKLLRNSDISEEEMKERLSYLKEKYGMAQFREFAQIEDDFQTLAKQFNSFDELKEYIHEYEVILQSQGTKAVECSKTSTDGIELLTMHASKGLEYDSVYLPGCMEGKIPSKKAVTEQDVEEERRMFYVAMTRAKHSLHISAVKGKTGKEISSRFLDAICPK